VDAEHRLFLPVEEEERHGQVRVFVRSISDVVAVHGALVEEGFLVTSSIERVREIQGYESVLDHLARVVSVLAAVVALLTVGVVFHEIAERKKRMMATLRVMGLSRAGVQTLLFTRGALVAAVAATCVVVLGLLASGVLNGVRSGLCVLRPADFGAVALGIGVVCLLGTWWPARSVSRVDPVVALQQAEER
jgi:putative ABC transport system permease protein